MPRSQPNHEVEAARDRRRRTQERRQSELAPKTGPRPTEAGELFRGRPLKDERNGRTEEGSK